MGAHAVGGYYSPNGNAWVRMKNATESIYVDGYTCSV